MDEDYRKLLDLSHHFGNMLNEIYAEKLSAVLPDFNCAACGKNSEVYLVADGCFKLSRAKKDNLVDTDPVIRRFFIPKQETVNARSTKLDTTIPADSCHATFNAAKAKPGKRGKNHDETGVSGLFCARHGTPLIFGDMFEGELFSIIDMLLIKYLERHTYIKKVFFYYDVNCKYKPHLLRLREKKEGRIYVI